MKNTKNPRRLRRIFLYSIMILILLSLFTTATYTWFTSRFFSMIIRLIS